LTDWQNDYELANFGGSPEYLSETYHYYKSVTITWSDPVEWPKADMRPHWEEPTKMKRAGLYVLMGDHGNKKVRREIQYVGMAQSFENRLKKSHHKANEIGSRLSGRLVSFGTIPYFTKKAPGKLGEIEDILMWALWPSLANRAGLETLPSMRPSTGKGQKKARAWIINRDPEGYDFGGQMPSQIVYPWMLIKK
jgi:hypothetical protein